MIQKSLRQSVLTYLRRGVQYASGLFPKLKLPLTRSAIPTIGVADFTFSRSTAATVIDFEGQILTTLINELRFPGARRVRNLLSNTETLSTQAVTVVSGRSYILSFSGTGSVTLSGAATGTLTGSTGRVQITKVASTTSLTLTVSGSVLQAQLEKVVGTQTVASEYVSYGVLSWPYHGAGVDGVKYFTTDRDGNLLDVDGALIEPSATNLLSYSTAYGTLFSNGTAAYTVDTEQSPDGEYNGKVYTFSSGAQTNYAIVSVTAGSVYCFSQWVALGTAKNAGYAIFDNTNSVWIVSAAQYSGLTTILQRKKVTFSVPATCTSIRIYPVRYIDASNLGTVRLFGAQLELSNLTSYIPTSGTTVTKTADIITYDVSSAISQGQGSIYSEFLLKGLTSSTTYILSLDDATSSNRISMYISSGTTLNVIMTSSGSSTVTSSLVTVSKDSVYKIMITYENNSFNVYINGTLVLTDTSCTVPTVTYLRFSKYDNSGQTNIQVKDFMYYKEVLKQSEAERRTS